jgi:hypothetical protein
MKLSELIDQAELAYSEHGDIPVGMECSEFTRFFHDVGCEIRESNNEPGFYQDDQELNPLFFAILYKTG